jgi:hypothetical protein
METIRVYDAVSLSRTAKILKVPSITARDSKLGVTIRKTLARLEFVITGECPVGQLLNNVAIPNIAHKVAENVNQIGDKRNFVWLLKRSSLVEPHRE